jgi:hypothetical protein
MQFTPGLIRPMEIINDGEYLSVLRDIVEERKVFEFFKQLLYRECDIHITDPSRTFSSTRVLLYNEAVSLPYAYVYLIDVVFTTTSRIFYFTYMDWTNTTTAIMSLTIGLYPELDVSVGYRIPTDAELNIEQFTFLTLEYTREQLEQPILWFLKALVDILRELTGLREYNVDVIRQVICDCLTVYVCVSPRLLNVLIYALRLRNHILGYITGRCICEGWKEEPHVCKCLSLCSLITERFPDAKQLCNELVQFATMRC